MKAKFLAMMATAVLLLGMTGCTGKDDNPAPISGNVQDEDLVGLWWDAYEYSGETEAGVPFSRV
ncbi:MAG: hypothetical protein K6E15_09625 [Prevotella sp.]|nr:hypothetical protein [Prevotella sp.]